MTYEIIILLMFVAFFAGTVDAIAGGGGLITVPALMLAGLSPVQAVATNKMQATWGVAFAAFSYYKQGQVNLRELLLPFIFTAIGAISGGICVKFASQEMLKTYLPYILLFVAAYFAFFPFLKLKPQQRTSILVFTLAWGLPIGFYDGFFGPGAGAFMLMGFNLFLGQDLLKAAGATKVLNFTSNFVSLLVFLWSDVIVWGVAMAMIVGQLLGAYLGVKLAVKFEAKLIRPLVIVVCIALSLKIMFFS